MKKFAMAAAAVMMMSGAASAQNLVKNGGFEQNTVDGSRQFTNNVTNWTNEKTSGYTGYGYNFLIKGDSPDGDGFTSLGGNHDYIYGTFGTANTVSSLGDFKGNYSETGYNGDNGKTWAYGNYILADGDPAFAGKISQVIGGLVQGNTYNLTFDWAAVTWFTTPGQTTQRFDVSLGNVVKSTETLTVAPKGASGWKKASLDFVAGGTSQTLSFLAKGTPNGLPPSLLLDNVSLTAAVPEPGTWMTMILGFGVVGATIRRRKASGATRPQMV